MGYNRAKDMCEYAGFDVALRDHLEHNLLPPLPASMFDAAKFAVEHAVEGAWDEEVPAPEGCEWKEVPIVQQLVEGWCLQAFIDFLTEDGDE